MDLLRSRLHPNQALRPNMSILDLLFYKQLACTRGEENYLLLTPIK